MIKNFEKFLLENQEVDKKDINIENDNIDKNEKIDKKDTNLTKYSDIITFTYLKPDSTVDRIKEICKTAEENNFYAVCVNPDFVSDAYGFLEENDVKICTVINYPKGNNKNEQNIKDVTKAISEGTDEIAFVIDYKEIKDVSVLEDMLKSHLNDKEYDKSEIDSEKEDIQNKYNNVEKKIQNVTEICHKNSINIKVIIESGELSYEQIKKVCEICDRCGVDYIMTSTGTTQIGAELDKVKYIRKILPDYMKIEVSGGIRSIQDAEKFYPYVDRISTSVVLKKLN